MRKKIDNGTSKQAFTGKDDEKSVGVAYFKEDKQLCFIQCTILLQYSIIVYSFSIHSTIAQISEMCEDFMIYSDGILFILKIKITK